MLINLFTLKCIRTYVRSNILRYYISTFLLELKQISESVGYPLEIYYLDSDPEPFRIVANYFK